MLVIETDDQTVESMRVMEQRQLADRRPGARRSRTASSTTRSAAPRAPPSSPASTRTTMACSATRRRTAASTGSRRCTGTTTWPCGFSDAGYYTAHDRQVPERLREQPAGAARLVGVAARPLRTRSEVYDYTLNQNGTLVHYGTDPADFKQDVLTRRAVEFVDRRAPMPKPFFLWLTYTAPHAGGPDPNPNPPGNCQRHGEAGAAPRPRVRLRAAAEAAELQRGRRLRQAGRDPEPARA